MANNIIKDLDTGTVNDYAHTDNGNIYNHTTLAHNAFGVLKVRRVGFLVRVDEHQVKWSGGRRNGLESPCGRTEDDVNFVDETCGGEVLRCNFDAMRVYFQSGDRTPLRKSTGQPSS
jgi:hypothetical protein